VQCQSVFFFVKKKGSTKHQLILIELLSENYYE